VIRIYSSLHKNGIAYCHVSPCLIHRFSRAFTFSSNKVEFSFTYWLFVTFHRLWRKYPDFMTFNRNNQSYIFFLVHFQWTESCSHIQELITIKFNTIAPIITSDNLFLYYFSFFVLLYWGYNVTFTKVFSGFIFFVIQYYLWQA
jgi:hypothetical protein